MTPTFPNIENVLNQMLTEMLSNLVSVGVSSNSNLYQSGEVATTIGPTQSEVSILFNDYFYYVAYGRGPTEQGTIPGQLRDIILNWITRKNIKARPGPDGRTPTDRQLAFLITRKIHEEGFQGRDFITSVVDQYEGQIDAAFLMDFEMNVKKLLAEIK
jgi:hypothetical protein